MKQPLCYIKGIEDYIAWTKNSQKSIVLANDHQEVVFEHNRPYYRGQACSTWPILASVFRKPFNSINIEHDLLSQANLKLWNELSVFSSYLEKLVFLQHYGMKTRLIDVTFNPLVALYFACIEDEKTTDNDGIVYCGYNRVMHNSRIAELTANYIFTHYMINIGDDIKEYAKKNDVQLWEFSQPIFLYPPINNYRVEYQHGAFVLSPLIKINDNHNVVLNNDPLESSCFFADNYAIIPSSYKTVLIKDLHLLGVDKETLFHGITDKIEGIIQEKLWDLDTINNIEL